jgi:hypothetical protein
MNPFTDSTDLTQDGPALSRRLRDDGYLFVQGLLPLDAVEGLRHQLLDIARSAGWTSGDGDTANLEAFCVEPNRDYMDAYAGMYCLPDFHALQHHPNLVGLFERVWGEPVLPHPRLIGRTIFPRKEAFTTPPHQDFIPIQGTKETYTAWIPLTDLPTEMGGLQIAAGSHTRGVYDFEPALGAGGLAVTDPLEGTWVGNSFAQGDVLIFHSLAVHKGLPNHSDRLRMSMDARYQRVSEPIAPGSLLPHSQPNDWDNIYQGWPSAALTFYWKKHELKVKDYDFSYHEKRDQLAIEMAERGDAKARATLERIVSRDADPAKQARAKELLHRLDMATDQK